MRATKVPTSAGDVATFRTGHGAPLALLHGNGHSFHEFDRMVPALAGQFLVTGWDMPGHGDSASADPDLSIESRAAVLETCLEDIVEGPVILVGNSIGAFIAAAFAARRPERVAGLVLAELQVRTAAWWNAAWGVVEQMFGMPEQSFDAVQARLCSPLDDDLLARWNLDRARAGAPAMIAAMAAIRDCDLRAILGGIAAPTLFLYGAKGPAADSADAAIEALPTARKAIVPDAGHFISIDRPGAFAKAIVNMAAQTGSG